MQEVESKSKRNNFEGDLTPTELKPLVLSSIFKPLLSINRQKN